MLPACSEDEGATTGGGRAVRGLDMGAKMAGGMVEEVVDRRSPAELVREVGEYRWSDQFME
jgi:hypothetical protein